MAFPFSSVALLVLVAAVLVNAGKIFQYNLWPVFLSSVFYIYVSVYHFYLFCCNQKNPLEIIISMISLADMKADCGPDGLTLVWTEARSLMDFSLLRLGSCRPTAVSLREAMFSVEFGDCNFRRTVGALYVCLGGVMITTCVNFHFNSGIN